MIMLNLTQGTPEWERARFEYRTASDAAAMLNVSPYKTREQLLREKKTGITPDVDAATQRRFDDGHRFEALARSLIEQTLCRDLYPCVGVLEGTKLSASFDGLTMEGDIVWEHKTFNATLSSVRNAADLPEHYRVQLEQQLLVSGAQQAIFMASEWDEYGELLNSVQVDYFPDPALRQRMIDGWAQFEQDLAAYEVQPLAAPTPTAKAPELLPVLNIRAEGKVLASNLDVFKQHALAVLDNINRDLQTDDDFATAEITVKWCKDVEKQLDVAWQLVLSQTTDIAAVESTIKEVIAHTRAVRLELEKLVKVEKENRKLELIQAAQQEMQDFRDLLQLDIAARAKELQVNVQLPPPPTLSHVLKGLRSLDSMKSALSTAVADYKMAANADARRIEANLFLVSQRLEYLHHFPDITTMIEVKQPDDLKNLFTARIAEYERRERERLEQERERIRAEETARLEREADERRLSAHQSQAASEAALHFLLPLGEGTGMRVSPEPVNVPSTNDRLVKLGDINALIAPLSISADGLKTLEILPAKIEKSAKLYPESDLYNILCILAEHIIHQARLHTEWKRAA